jgi:hypothetical protein
VLLAALGIRAPGSPAQARLRVLLAALGILAFRFSGRQSAA